VVISTESSEGCTGKWLTLVDIGLGVVGDLVLLVDNGILGGAGTGGNLSIVVLGDVLVGLLGSFGTGALNGLGDVVHALLMGG
jgi:hypothetical protein